MAPVPTAVPAPADGQTTFGTTSVGSTPQPGAARGMAFNRSKISISSAQLLALFTTPQEIVPAPGPGFMIVPYVVLAKLIFGTTAYTTAGHAISANIGTTTASLGDVLAQAADAEVSVPMSLTLGARTIVDNVAMLLKIATANPTLGDGTLIVEVLYNIFATKS